MIEIRTTGTAKRQGNKLVGVAAPFNSLSLDLGGFKEQILPGAFRRSLENNNVVSMLHNHDSASVLASTANGSLKLRETSRGLEFEATPADTGLGRDLLTLAQRGDIQNMSFGFRVRGTGGERWRETDQGITRDLIDVELFEISSTAFPAYPASSMSARSAVDQGDAPARLKRDTSKRRRQLMQRRVTAAEAALIRSKPTPKPQSETARRLRSERMARQLQSRSR